MKTRVRLTCRIPRSGAYPSLSRQTSDWLVLWKMIRGKLVYVGPKAEYLDGKSTWGKKE